MRQLRFVAFTLLTALTLSGCTTTTWDTEPILTDVSPRPVTSDAPKYTAGEVVDEETAAAMNRRGEGRYRGYEMADGTFLVVDRFAPTPDVVQEDADARAAEYSLVYPNAEDVESDSGQKALHTMKREITRGTGKKVIVVIREEGFDYSGNAIVNWYALGGGMKADGNIRTRDELATAIELQLTNKDPDDYLVVWPG